MRSVLHRLALFLVLGSCCRADLTLRYTVEVKAGSAAAAVPTAMEVRIKGDKTLTKLGALTKIVGDDSVVTLVNPATKQYAQTTVAEYAGLRAALPLASAALKNLNFGVETRTTGRSETISGIRAEERLTALSVSANAPGAAAGPLIRVDLHTWLAGPDDLNAVPMLRQYAASAQRAMNASAAGDAVEKLFQQLPGATEKLRSITDAEALSAGSLALKVQEAFYNLKGDPNAPIVSITIELVDISTGAIDDSVFAVPPDFQPASVAELIKASTPVPSAGPAPVRPNGAHPAGVPMVIYKRDPEYTQEARQAKLEGAVTLRIVVGADGVPKNIQVLKSLGLGLDEKAIEAVSQWRFRPAEKDGQPVDFPATIQLNFRLVDRPPQQ